MKPYYHSVKVRECFQKDVYDSLIRFFLLCSYSDLYIYNLDQENNLPFMVVGHTMVNCIINLCLFYFDPRYKLLHRRVSAGSVIAAGLATYIVGCQDTAAGQANNHISDMDIVVMIGALLLISLAFIEGFFYNSFIEENDKNLELEAILLIAFIGVFFYNSFSGSSTEIEENDKNLESEEEEFEVVGTLVGQLINRSTIDEKTGEKILFAWIFGCYDGWLWEPTPLIVRCKVSENDKLRGRPLFSYD